MEMILASASPRRARLLADLGLTFRIVPSAFNERHPKRPAEPARLAEALALGKAREVADRLGSGLVIGADTIVILDGLILEKPENAEDAHQMLRALSGKWHLVYTGIALVRAESADTRLSHACTRVKFRDLTETEIEAYVNSGDPMDKAGAYGIQGLGAILVEKIEGCYTNVVGLPLSRLVCMLRDWGIDPLEPWK